MRSFFLVLIGWLAAPLLYAAEPVILVLGDSLSAGYGMALEQAWPSLLQQRLQQDGRAHRVLNASITGETTRGGLNRLAGLLERHQPDVVIVELGGNDGLRGLRLEATHSNLGSMIRQSKESGAEVLLAGIQIPPNYGRTYTERFRDLYAELAEQHGAKLIPFFMEGVALDPGLMQGDGIHPNAQAQPVLLDNVWPLLAPTLD